MPDDTPGDEPQNDILEGIAGLLGFTYVPVLSDGFSREAVNDILEDIRLGLSLGGGGGGGGITEAAADARYVNVTGDSMGGQLLIVEGSLAAPGLAFVTDTNTGIHQTSAGNIALVSDGSVSLLAGPATVSTSRILSISNGTAGAPALTFSGDSTSGLYLIGSNILGFTTNGVERLRLSTSALTSTVPVVLPTGPVSDLQAATKKYVDDAITAVASGIPEAPLTGQAYLRQSAGWVSQTTLGLDQATLDARYLRLVGGTLTGLLTLSGVPTVALHAATKGYVDGLISGGTAVDSTARTAAATAQTTANNAMPIAGGTFTGMILLSGAPTLGLHPTSKTYVDGLISGGTAVDSTARTSAGDRVLKAGDTMTGALLMPNGLVGTPALSASSDPNTGIYFSGADVLHIASGGSLSASFSTTLVTFARAVVLPAGTAGAPAVAFTGGTTTGLFLSGSDLGLSVSGTARATLSATALTMTVPIVSSGAPTLGTHLANKTYVDGLIAGLSFLTDAPVDGVAYGRRNNAWEGVLRLAGGILTGNVTFPTGTDIAPSLLFGTGLGISGFGGEIVLTTGSLPRASIGTAGIATPYQMIGKVGAATSPSFSFLGDLNTGFYNAGPDSIGVSTNDALRFTFASTVHTSTVPILLPGAPTLALHAATKDYVDVAIAGVVVGVDTVARAAASAAQATADAALPKAGGTMTGIITLPTSAASAPGINHSGSTNTGLYFPSNGVVGLASEGVLGLTVSNAAITAGKQILALAGSAGAPGLSLIGDPNTGIYSAGVDELGVSAGGTLRFTVSTTTLTSTLPLLLPSNPTLALQAATKQYVDGLITGGTAVDSTARTAASTAQTTADGKVAKAGDTMTGLLTLSGVPTVALHAATKGYVDGLISGGTAVDSTARTNASNAQTTANNAETNANGRVSKSGDTMTGFLVLHASPVSANQAASKGYVDGLITGGTAVDSTARTNAATAQTTADGKVSKTGDTMTGPLVLPDGSLTNPAIAFTSSTNTGIRRSAVNTLAFVTNGVDRVTINTLSITYALPVRVESGSAGAPGVSFSAETTTGIFQPALGQIGIATAGTQRLLLTSTLLTSTVPVVLPADPTTALQAATKQYVDGLVGSPVDSVARAAAATAQSEIDAHEALTNNPHGTTAAQVGALTPATAASTYLALAGGTLTGTLSLVAGAPTLAAHATRKDYVDGEVATRLTAAAANLLYQPLDADLTAIAGLTSAADRLPYFTGTGTAALATFTNFGRTLIDDVDATAARTTLGLGTAATSAATAFQATDAELTAIAGLVSAADRLPYFTGSGTATLATFTAFGRSLVDDADATAARTTLGLGTAATSAATAFQATDATLTALAGLTFASRAVVELTAADVFTLRPIGTTNATDQLDRAAGDTRYLQLSGGTLTGILTLSADPTIALHAATKQYVDSRTPILTDAPNDGQEYVRKNLAWAVATGGGGGIADAPSDSTTYGRNNAAWVNVLRINGGTLTGALVLAADPVVALGAATKQYVDAGVATRLTQTAGDARYLQLSGGTLTGLLTLSGAPTVNLHAATKLYVDTEVATRLTPAAAAAAYQPLDADLTAIAGLTSAADRLPYFSGSGTAALTVFTAAGRALLDDADADAQRTTLGLGTMATEAAASYLAKAGGTMTGELVARDGTFAAPSISAATELAFGVGATGYFGVDGTVVWFDIPLQIPDDPIDASHAANKAYVDGQFSVAITEADNATTQANLRVLKSGDTMSGALVLHPGTGLYGGSDPALWPILRPAYANWEMLAHDGVDTYYTALTVRWDGIVASRSLTLNALDDAAQAFIVVGTGATTTAAEVGIYIFAPDLASGEVMYLRLDGTERRAEFVAPPRTNAVLADFTHPSQLVSKEYVDEEVTAITSGITVFSAAATYAVGALVTQGNDIYRCKTAVVVPAAFNALEWSKISTNTTDGDTFNDDITLLGSATHQAILNFNHPSGRLPGIFSKTDGVNRWSIKFAQNDAETGSNTGSNFSIQRYTDAGSGQWVMRTNRATGNIQFGNHGQLSITAAATISGDYNDANPRVLSVYAYGNVATAAPEIAFIQGDAVTQIVRADIRAGRAGGGASDGTLYLSPYLAGVRVDALTVSPTLITATVPVALPADPTAALHAATKQYVDAVNTNANSRVLKAGDTMTGALTIAVSNPQIILDTNSPTDYSNRSIIGRTGGVMRWNMQIGAGTESGSNTGGDFIINRSDDAGAALGGTTFRIQRSTGNIGMGAAANANWRLLIQDPTDLTVTDMRALRLQNTNTVADGSVNIEFATASGALRAAITGKREGASNHGMLRLSSALSGVEQPAIEIASSRQVTFLGSSAVILPAGVVPTADDHAANKKYVDDAVAGGGGGGGMTEAQVRTRSFLRC